MDKIIESFNEFIDGANKVELCYDADTTGVTRVIVSTLQYEYDDEGVATHPYWEIRRVGFARRKAANEALGNMQKALIDMGFQLEEAKYSFSKWSHENDW